MFDHIFLFISLDRPTQFLFYQAHIIHLSHFVAHTVVEIDASCELNNVD